MSEPNEQVEAFARILAAIESRKSGWGFTLDQAIEYRAEKWRRHVYEAERLLDEMGPWLAEHDRQVAERAWDEGHLIHGEDYRHPHHCRDSAGCLAANPYRIEKYRKKPVEIEAMRYTGTPESCGAIHEWCGYQHNPEAGCDSGIYIDTLEGQMRADVGDWIIRGVQGEFYPCKPDIFEATYEAVSDD